jgi:hypothetical protein
VNVTGEALEIYRQPRPMPPRATVFTYGCARFWAARRGFTARNYRKFRYPVADLLV